MGKKPPDPAPPDPSVFESDIGSEVEITSISNLPLPSSTPKKRKVGDLPKNESPQASIPVESVVPPLVTLYPTSAKAPFIVYVQNNTPGHSLHPLDFGKFLGKKPLGISPGGIRSEGRFRICVEFTSALNANKFINSIDFLSAKKFKAYIPSFNVSRMGLVRGIPTDLSEDELISELIIPASSGKVIKTRRLNFKDRSSEAIVWKPSQTVVLTFEGQTLPSHVYLFHNSLPVEMYSFPTIQCFNCCRFGHSKISCRSSPRCFKCAESHLADQCPSPSNPPTCVNCSGSHTAINPSCPELSRQKNIKSYMASNSVSYFHASKIIAPSKKSFAEVTSQPLLSQISTPSNLSYRKTVLTKSASRPIKTPGYDQSSHNAQLLFPNGNKSSLFPQNPVFSNSNNSSNCSDFNPDSNANSLHNNISNDNSSFIQTLLMLLISIINNNNSLPSNAASLLSSLYSLLPNGCPSSSSSAVEL